MLAEAEQFAIDTALAAAGVSVTYQRGATSVAVSALVGVSGGQEQGDQTSVHDESIDFIVRVADLAALGNPQRHDTITHNGVVYTVTPFLGEGEFRFTSGHAYAYRIHTNRIL